MLVVSSWRVSQLSGRRSPVSGPGGVGRSLPLPAALRHARGSGVPQRLGVRRFLASLVPPGTGAGRSSERKIRASVSLGFKETIKEHSGEVGRSPSTELFVLRALEVPTAAKAPLIFDTGP